MTSFIPGQEIELTLESLVSDGRALARCNGLVVLVEGALPGQQVRACVDVCRARMAEAHMVQILSPSPYQCPPSCPHPLCGSCEWQCLDYEQQLFWKTRMVQDALERVGHIPSPNVLPALASPLKWGYRNKMSFAFDRGNPLCLGMRQHHSKEVTDITDCALQSELGKKTLAALRELIRKRETETQKVRSVLGALRFAVIRESNTDECVVELIVAPLPQAKKGSAKIAAQIGNEMGAALRKTVPEVTGFVLSERAASTDIAQGESLVHAQGRTSLHTRQNGLVLEWDCRTFFQVNTGAAELLCTQAHRMLAPAKGDTLWDLYCGVGTVGLSLAQDVAQVYGLESSAPSVNLARKNAATAGFAHCTFEAGDANAAFRAFPRPNAVVVDPPRAGLERTVVENLLQLAPPKLLYISCNPATLARDAALLLQKYRLAEAVPLDMFPQTPHVECLALFVLDQDK